jgi:hypothetical protein
MGSSAAPWRRVILAMVIALFMVGNLVVAPAPVLAVGGVSGNLSGTVTDGSGKPLAGAQISVASASGSYQATTSATGVFTLTGLPTDTYTLSIQAKGFDARTLTGVTVSGDSTIALGKIVLSNANAQVIGVVHSRSASSAFQPNAAVNATTLSGARIEQALGNVANTNEQQLLLSAPGVTQSSSGNTSIRGSTTVELGYQFDGVNYTSPYFDENAGAGQGGNGGGTYKPGGYLPGLFGGTGGSVQVVTGSGDATQGNIGAGVINIIPPRGSYPGNGLVNLGLSSGVFDNEAQIGYGLATPDGKLSDYVYYSYSRYTPLYTPQGSDAATQGQYGNGQNINQRDFLNNFIFKFGADNDQSIQFLVRENVEWVQGNYGGLGAAYDYHYSPPVVGQFGGNTGFLGLYGLSQTSNVPGSPYNNADPFVTLFQQLPYEQVPNNPNGLYNSPEQIQTSPTSFIKLGYTKNFGSSTFLSADYYNLVTQQTNENYSLNTNPVYQTVGGSRTGFDLSLTHQFGDSHTVTIAGKFENGLPQWDAFEPGYSSYALALGPAGYLNGLAYNQPTVTAADWNVPTVNANLVSNPTTNPCQSGPFTGATFTNPQQCYIHDYLVSHGLWTGTMPQIPTFGISYHATDFQTWGVGIRDQWQVNSKLKFDYGVREDAANYKFGPNIYQNSSEIFSNPSDLGSAQLTASFLTPHVIQPRVAGTYLLDPNNSVSASYGRSVEFAFAQLAGTPMNLYNVNPVLNQIPAIGQTTGGVATPSCGSGYNNTNSSYQSNPNIPSYGVGKYFTCQNLAQQIFWLYDQYLDAPDYGGAGQPTYSNYDFTYQHQFSKGLLAGYGTRLTTFWRRGFNIFENVLLTNGPPNPATGQASGTTFSTKPDGIEKTFGTELSITSPNRPYGWTGFVTADYLASYQTIPGAAVNYPGQNAGQSADGFQALLSQPLFGTGVLFRSGYLPPFSIRAGIAYTTKSGFKIQPILSGNSGYPTGVGTSTITYVDGVLQFVPSTNYGSATPIGGAFGPNHAYNAPAYVDPALPGSLTSPNVYATRGYQDAPLVGGVLSRAQFNADLDLEYSLHKDWTIGAYISNLMNNHYGNYVYNTKWQPVATGVGGPQTGQNITNSNPASSGYDNYITGTRDQNSQSGGYLPVSIEYNPGTTVQLYLQKKL